MRARRHASAPVREGRRTAAGRRHHDLGRAVGLAERALVLVRGRAAWLEAAALSDAATLEAAASAVVAGMESAR
jgi:hypothetical protein